MHKFFVLTEAANVQTKLGAEQEVGFFVEPDKILCK